jgi:hypothetical protein
MLFFQVAATRPKEALASALEKKHFETKIWRESWK